MSHLPRERSRLDLLFLSFLLQKLRHLTQPQPGLQWFIFHPINFIHSAVHVLTPHELCSRTSCNFKNEILTEIILNKLDKKHF